MKLTLLDLFACPVCGHETLVPGPKPLPASGELTDGELRCASCSRAYPVRGGVPDFYTGGHRPSFSQRFMEMSPVTKIYEERWRPRFIKSVSPGLTLNEEMRNVTRWLRPAGGELVLDIACGPGLYTRPIAGLVASAGKKKGPGGQVVGLDISTPMLKEAVRLARSEGIANVTYLRGDVHRLPFRSKALFDHATCMAAFHLFPDPDRVARGIAGVLKPGGTFCLLTTHASRNPLVNAAQKASERFSGLRFFGDSELDGILRGAGFIPGDRKIYGSMVMLQAVRSSEGKD